MSSIRPSVVDLRSDTVTRPTAEMYAAMRAAELGDDVLGDDPTVRQLEETIASRLGKEAACFVPSGTMANQSAIRALTRPGDEIIAHRDSHVIHYETGALAGICGVQVRPIDGAGGVFDPAEVDAAVRPANHHSPRTSLLVLENTNNRGGGTVWRPDAFAAACAAARRRGLRIHLDGARLFNACVALMAPPTTWTRLVDTVSVCFSKGLGAPAGSAVAGDAATIGEVRRLRKMLGGAMRQSGLLAAAALHALDRHVERLEEDHRLAERLAEGVETIAGLALVPMPAPRTNMVFFDLDPRCGSAASVCAALEAGGVRLLPFGPQRLRAVTHLDVDAAGIARAIAALRAAVAGDSALHRAEVRAS
ncbi:MAG TPA: GntG family PLP-dependent aldolase [Phycisphaerales bacterium]|nr:GntG family PLP-dependent aldolase [Phycisphaerales bacterium]HMP36169.1 GntG family PLP-dependent aldolase [Phycisphaerales bacterium]